MGPPRVSPRDGVVQGHCEQCPRHWGDLPDAGLLSVLAVYADTSGTVQVPGTITKVLPPVNSVDSVHLVVPTTDGHGVRRVGTASEDGADFSIGQPVTVLVKGGQESELDDGSGRYTASLVAIVAAAPPPDRWHCPLPCPGPAGANPSVLGAATRVGPTAHNDATSAGSNVLRAADACVESSTVSPGVVGVRRRGVPIEPTPKAVYRTVPEGS